MTARAQPAASTTATAYWTVAPGRGELRRERLDPPGPGQVLVRTLHSGISRGTESLIHRGEVPESVRQRMRAPFQEGDLPGPVKYGYLSVGVVEAVGRPADSGPGAPGAPRGPIRDDVHGRVVFCLYPHQDRYVVPADAVTVVPDGVPPARAVLTGTVETAVNAVWDAGPRLGDRVAVVGAGMVGCAVAAVLRAFPLDRLEIVDVDPARRGVAQRLGVEFRTPREASADCDVVLHCSASAAGLNRGLELLGDEGELVELSWYGAREVSVSLGGAFHARRLSVRGSQVGAIAASRRSRRSHADRLALALDLLKDAVFDELITSRGPFSEVPDVMRRIADGELTGLCHALDYA